MISFLYEVIEKNVLILFLNDASQDTIKFNA